MKQHEDYLKEHGVKPTAVRILVWGKIFRKKETFTLADIQSEMPHMDRSSIFNEEFFW